MFTYYLRLGLRSLGCNRILTALVVSAIALRPVWSKETRARREAVSHLPIANFHAQWCSAIED